MELATESFPLDGEEFEDDQLEGPPVKRVIEAATGIQHPSDSSSLGIDESALVSVVEALYRRARNDKRWKRVESWEYNRAFYEDHAWAIWDPANNSIELDPPRPNASSKRVQINLFKSFVTTAAARIAATHPVILVHAASTDQEDIDNAHVTQVWIDTEWNRQEMARLVARSVIPFQLDGTLIWAIEWDPTRGAVVGEVQEPVLNAAGEVVLDADGVPMMRTVNVHEGEIVTRRVDCRNFFVEPNELDLDDMQYCMEVTTRTPAWIYRHYQTAVQPDGIDQKDERAVDAWYTGDITKHETVREMRVWISPGPLKWGPEEKDVVDLPEGLYVCVAGGRVLEGPWANPYDDHEFPYVAAKALPNDDDFFGETIFNSLRSPQVTLNKVASLILESVGYMAMPVWLEPASADFMESDRTNVPGAFYKWDDSVTGIPPQRLEGSGPSASAFRALDFIVQMFHMLSGLSEGGMFGGPAKNIESGIGLEVITERDASKMSITSMEMGHLIQLWGEKTVSRGQQFIDEPRMVRRVGRQLEAEVVEWSGDLVGEGWEIRVVAESIEPMTKQQRMQEALLMLQYGIWTVEDARRHIGFEMQTGELSNDQLQRNLARNENKQSRHLGRVLTPVEQMSLEDHLLHIEEHERELFHPANQDWTQGVSPGWMASMAHLQMHYKLLKEELMKRQGVAPGGAPPPGQESVPPAEEGAREVA